MRETIMNYNPITQRIPMWHLAECSVSPAAETPDNMARA